MKKKKKEIQVRVRHKNSSKMEEIVCICYLELEGEIMAIHCRLSGCNTPLTVTVTYDSSGNGEVVLAFIERYGFCTGQLVSDLRLISLKSDMPTWRLR